MAEEKGKNSSPIFCPLREEHGSHVGVDCKISQQSISSKKLLPPSLPWRIGRRGE